MPLSHYLLIIPLPGQPGNRLLFSCKTCGVVVLPAQALAKVQDGSAPPELLAALTELSLVVEDLAEEQRKVCRYLEEVNSLNPNLRVSVILGLACNFACIYCYEGKDKGAAAMDDATAEQLCAYLLNRFTPGKKRLILDFYGGEPLLYAERIRSLARQLKPAIESLGGVFEFTLVTNGSLFTPELVKEFGELGLVSAKITIDGPADNHNRFRPCKNGQGSWAAIVANLIACRTLCPITLSGNYTSDNFRHFPELLPDLEANGLSPEDFAEVQFFPVMQVNDRFANPEFSSGCCSMREPWLVEASLFLKEEIMRRGYNFPKLQPAICMVDLDDSFTVNHDGLIYKCVTLIGHPEFACGDIRRGLDHGWQESYCVDHWQKEKECRECAYLPLCFGGCRYMALQREGSMAKVDCQKEFLDSALAKMLAQDVKYRYASKLAPTDPA